MSLSKLEHYFPFISSRHLIPSVFYHVHTPITVIFACACLLVDICSFVRTRLIFIGCDLCMRKVRVCVGCCMGMVLEFVCF